MKRICTLFLTLVMLITSLGAGTAFAENETAPAEEVVTTPLDTDEFHALYAMGFIGDELNGADKDELITRANFIGYLFKLAGYTVKEHRTDDIPFVDVSTQTPYYNEICTMYEMGRVNGTEPNMFSPDDHVTYSQACKLIVDVLGYRNYTEIKYGTMLEAYAMMAAELDIDDGVTDVKWNSELTSKNAVRMLYNAGCAEMLKFAGTDENGKPRYETDGTDLFATNNIYYGEGVMQSNGFTSIIDESAISGVTVISGKKYDNADTDLSNLIGCKVKYFYRDDKVSQKLLWATTDKRFSNMLDLKAVDLAVASAEYSRTNVVYYEADGDTESAKINPMADVIYNNSHCSIYTIDDIRPLTGTMRLIDNNDDEIYDVVIVYEYDNLFVTHIYEEKEQIFAKYNKTVDFSEYEEVKIIRDGKEVTINDIDNQSVLSYIVNKEKTRIWLYQASGSFKDVPKTTEVVRGRKVYGFDDRKYLLSNAYKAIIEDSSEYAVLPAIGKEYTFWLDIFGEIAEVQEVTGEFQYALLMSVREGEPYEDCEAYTRLLLPNNNKVTGGIEKKVIVNGEKKTPAQFLADTRLYEVDDNGQSKFMVQVVQVSFDGEGLLNKLNFANDTQAEVGADGEALYPYGYDASRFSRDYKSKGVSDDIRIDGYYMIDDKYLVTAETIVFARWEEMDTTEPYEVVNRNTISSGSYLKDVYDVADNMKIGAMYREGLYHKANWKNEALIIDNIDYIYEDDQEVKRISGYVSGKYTTYVEEQPGIISDRYGHGDIVRVSVRNNKLNNIFMEVSADEIRNKTTKVINNPSGSEPDQVGVAPAWNGGRTAVFAPLYRMDQDSATVLTPSAWSSSVGSFITSPKGYDTVILTIYDYKNDEIYRGDYFEMYQKYTLKADGTIPGDADNIMAYVRMRYVTLKEITLVLY